MTGGPETSGLPGSPVELIWVGEVLEVQEGAV